MKYIIFPNGMSEDLAELVGIHLGDGSLSVDRYNYNITYSGNLQKDKIFMDYINKQYFLLFGIKFKILLNPKKNSIELRIRSKLLYNFLKDSLDIPAGKKTNLVIPHYIKSDKKYLVAFLRGLFDTDGCLTLQRNGKYTYLLAKISTKHKTFADDILYSLNTLNIPSFITTKSNKDFEGYDVVIRNKNVKLFFDIIGSKNSRNIKNYKKWGCRDLNPDFGS